MKCYVFLITKLYIPVGYFQWRMVGKNEKKNLKGLDAIIDVNIPVVRTQNGGEY